MWIAIAEKWISEPTIKNSATRMSINQDVYMNRCLQPNLLPFSDGESDYIFWPDLARAHYARRTLDFLEMNNIPYVPKSMNPPNVPQCRPIEDFFGALETRVYEGAFPIEIVSCDNRIARVSILSAIDFLLDLCSNIVFQLSKLL